MTSLLNSTTPRRLNSFGRALAGVLLMLVVYGATVEAAHSHGGLVPARNADAPAVGQTNENDLTTKQSSQHGDCLICQLQQHLSNGLTQTHAIALQPLTANTVAPASVAHYFSQTATPRRGRAPPAHSLR